MTCLSLENVGQQLIPVTYFKLILRGAHTTAYSANVCRRMRHFVQTLVYVTHVRHKFCITAETQSGLPLLPWSCYASVIQCDIIQYLLFLFYYNTGIISFLAIYNDTILCTIFCVNERLYAKNTVFNML